MAIIELSFPKDIIFYTKYNISTASTFITMKQYMTVIYFYIEIFANFYSNLDNPSYKPPLIYYTKPIVLLI